MVVLALLVLGSGLWIVLAKRSRSSGDELDSIPVKERYRDISRPSSDPVLGRELIPGAGRGLTVVNELGFIGPAVSNERKGNALRILGLGDANSMYYGAEGQNYLRLLEKTLATPEQRVETLNFAVEGDSLKSEVRRLEVAGLSFKPDVVLVGFSPDDVVDLAASLSDDPQQPPFDVHTPDAVGEFAKFYKRLGTSQEVKQAFFDKAFASSAWRDAVMALIELNRLAKLNGFRVVVVALPVLVSFEPYQFQPLHDAIKVQAERHGFGFVDVSTSFAATRNLAALRESGDALTYNPAAHEIVARIVGEVLRSDAIPDPRASVTHGE